MSASTPTRSPCLASARKPLWLLWAASPTRAMAIVFVVAMLGLGSALGLNGTGLIGWHASVRATAVFAFPLWLLAYLAGPIARLAPGPTTRALRARRRAIGLAFFVAQYVHLAAIVGLARIEPGILEDPTAVYGGGFGFLMVAVLAATSNDASVKRLGESAWRRLHAFGQLTLAVVYLATYGPLIDEDLAYWPAGALLLGAYALRGAAALRTRGAAGRG